MRHVNHPGADAPVIAGASGHAKVVIEVLRDLGASPRVCLETSPAHSTCMGLPVLAEAEFLQQQGLGNQWTYFVAIGDNVVRATIFARMANEGGEPCRVISPASYCSPTATVGVGTLVMPGACINADAQVGVGVIVNTGAVVEHDCVVGDFAHLAPNATLGGWVEIGEQALIGLGAAVLPRVRIGAGAVVGAGTVVLEDVPAGATVLGNPARVVRRG